MPSRNVMNMLYRAPLPPCIWAPTRAASSKPGVIASMAPGCAITASPAAHSNSSVENVGIILMGIGLGMIGLAAGGYLGQLYVHRYPEAFAGLLLDSTAPCFREAVLDPASVLSPPLSDTSTMMVFFASPRRSRAPRTRATL